MAALASRGNIIVITIPGQRNLDDRLAALRNALKELSVIEVDAARGRQRRLRSAF